MLSAKVLSMKESLMAAEVNFMSEGTPSLAWITVCTLIPPFFLPVLGCRPTPLKSRFEMNPAIEALGVALTAVFATKTKNF